MSKYIMLIVGFIMLAINAMGYIFNLNIKHPALTIMGLVFVVIGMQKARQSK